MHLYSKTDPIVEASHHMLFAPFNGACPRLDAAFRSSSLPPAANHWNRLFDFSKDDATLPTPHWALMGASRGGWGEI